MIVIAALALSGLAARLVQIQGVDAAHYASYGSQEVYQRVALPALRGAIYDRNGNLLAASASRVDVVADDYLVTDLDAGLGPLASILGLPATTLRAKLTEHSGYVPLAYQVSDAVEQKVASLDLPYLSFEPDVARTDPDGNLFSPVLGIVGFGGRALSGLEYMDNCAARRLARLRGRADRPERAGSARARRPTSSPPARARASCSPWTSRSSSR